MSGLLFFACFLLVADFWVYVFPWHFYCWKLWYFLCSFVLLLLTVWLIFDANLSQVITLWSCISELFVCHLSFFNAIETEPRNFVFECLIWFSLNSTEESASSSTLICVWFSACFICTISAYFPSVFCCMFLKLLVGSLYVLLKSTLVKTN